MDMIPFGLEAESQQDPLICIKVFKLLIRIFDRPVQYGRGLGKRGHLKQNDILEDFVIKLFKELSFSHPASWVFPL